MNYSLINKTDVANGKGVRVSIFVSGCRNNCDGCFNKETWDFNYGDEFDWDTTFHELIKAIDKPYIKGLSILGGEPLDARNYEDVIRLCSVIKRAFHNKDIWLYTGYEWEDAIRSYPEIADCVDVVVDGRFVERLRDPSLAFRGSSNQRIIDVKKSIKDGAVVLYE